MPDLIYQFSNTLNNGDIISLKQWQGKVILIVNTASACGLTPQYQGLQELQDRFLSRGFTVLAFPCNQFGQQESGSNEEIKNFCDLQFQISFPLFQKVDVNGSNADPLFTWLKQQQGGLFGAAIKWNFTKFLIDATGKPIKRYAPTTKPADIAADIEKLLQ
ncbi:MAG: glutathione peroxidase [Ferrimonas sp.]